jgi:hypothetical protein
MLDINVFMGNKQRIATGIRLSTLADLLIGLPWISILADVWVVGKRVLGSVLGQGMYEVLEYESTLELKDTKGKNALFRKRQKVRYLQDNIIAYQDQAWGDGKILLNYRCSPGVSVDRHRPGRKTYILISLREVKHRGEEDEFNIEWGIQNGFLRTKELWETEISHPTRHLKVRVIFPKDRPPKRMYIVEGSRQKSHPIGSEKQRQLPNGRWQVVWEKENPHLNERYILKWSW